MSSMDDVEKAAHAVLRNARGGGKLGMAMDSFNSAVVNLDPHFEHFVPVAGPGPYMHNQFTGSQSQALMFLEDWIKNNPARENPLKKEAPPPAPATPHPYVRRNPPSRLNFVNELIRQQDRFNSINELAKQACKSSSASPLDSNAWCTAFRALIATTTSTQQQE